MADDLGEKTEDATPKRRQQARQQGNVPRSQDLSAAVILFGATLILYRTLMPTLGKFKLLIETMLDGSTVVISSDPTAVRTALNYAAGTAVSILIPILLGMWVIAYLANFSQIGWLLAPNSIKPSLSKINPIGGLKKLFGVSAVVKAGLDVLKVILVMTVAVFTIRQYLDEIMVMPYLPALQCLRQAGWMMLDLVEVLTDRELCGRHRGEHSHSHSAGHVGHCVSGELLANRVAACTQLDQAELEQDQPHRRAQETLRSFGGRQGGA